jgi:hypothetical protein
MMPPKGSRGRGRRFDPIGRLSTTSAGTLASPTLGPGSSSTHTTSAAPVAITSTVASPRVASDAAFSSLLELIRQEVRAAMSTAPTLPPSTSAVSVNSGQSFHVSYHAGLPTPLSHCVLEQPGLSQAWAGPEGGVCIARWRMAYSRPCSWVCRARPHLSACPALAVHALS